MKKNDPSPIPPLLNRRFFLIAASSFTLSTVIASCRSNSPGGNGGENRLRVGAGAVPNGEILKYVKDNLATPAGLEITYIEFNDFVLPNLALRDKEIDANFFQHVPFMEDFGKQHNIDLVAVVPVSINPLGLYSRKIKSLSEVSDGAKVSIPSDLTNLGRSLKLLEANNLLELRSGAGISTTTQDIVKNPKNIQLVELEAAQLARALEDVELGVVNGGNAIRVGLIPAKDALALESGKNNPYANVLAVLRGRETDPNIVKLGQLLTSPEVKKFIEDKYQGSVIAAF